PVVGVDAPIAQEGPVAPRLADQPAVAFDDQDLLAVLAGARQHTTEWIADERTAPELQAAFDADAIDRRDEHAVGDRMRALNGLPRRILRLAVLCLLARMPADGGGIEEDLRPTQRGEARGFRKPLIPADQR